MPRQPEQTLPLPLDATDPERFSLDPGEWRAYRDRLRDAAAPESEWQRAQRIADSLTQEVNLVLVNFCEARHLNHEKHGNHFLRIGKTWFIGGERTFIDTYSFIWWRRDWVVSGFARFPSSDPERDVERLIALNYGTPWDMPHPRWSEVRSDKDLYETAIECFFITHTLVEIPPEYAESIVEYL
jgi:hypothetical protein